MTEPFRVGDLVSLDGATSLEVVTYRLAGARQVMSLMDAAGAIVTVAVDLDRTEGDGGIAVAAGPVDLGIARALALDVLSGHQRARLPVAAELNLLAAAIVDLTGGVEPCAAG
jgi:hypothetical protein